MNRRLWTILGSMVALALLGAGWPRALATAGPAVEIEAEESAYLARAYLSGRAFGACLYGEPTEEGTLKVDRVALLARRNDPEICYGPRVLGAVLFTRTRGLPQIDLARTARQVLIFRPDWKVFAVVDNVRPSAGRDALTGQLSGSYQAVEGLWITRQDFRAVPLVVLGTAHQ